jgi:rod shape-determining protein MreB and related proteins
VPRGSVEAAPASRRRFPRDLVWSDYRGYTLCHLDRSSDAGTLSRSRVCNTLSPCVAMTYAEALLQAAVASWATILAAIAGLAAVVQTLIAGVQHFQMAARRSALERSFGADFYPSDQIDFVTRHYVRSSCSSVDPTHEAEIRHVVATHEDLFTVVDRLLATPSSHRHILLLADSGMGKTSFVINYYARNMQRRRRHRLAVVPLGIPEALAEIDKIENKRDTVLFLDAFDEDTKAIEDYASRLSQIMAACAQFRRVLVTCRTQFFPSDAEIPLHTGLPIVIPRPLGQSGTYAFTRLYLSPLSDEQVEAFLRRRFPWFMFLRRRNARTVVHRIPLLSVRPMLLAYLPDALKADAAITRASQVYEVMVEAWLERERRWFERAGLRFDNRRVRCVSETLATDMYVNRQRRGSEMLTRNELADIVSKHYEALELSTFKSRSLLNRDAEGSLKFAHRSILEYLFVTGFLRRDLDLMPPFMRTDPAPGASCAWTDAMKAFVVEMIVDSRALPSDAPRGRFEGVDLSGCILQGADLRGMCFDGTRLSGANLSGALLSQCSFKRADLRNASLTRADLTGADFSNADLSEADLRDAIDEGIVLEGATVVGLLRSARRVVAAELQASSIGFLRRGPDVAVQVGTSFTRIFIAGSGIRLCEPSVVLFDRAAAKSIAFGREAEELHRRHPNRSLVQPVEDGAISNPALFGWMLEQMLVKAVGGRYRVIGNAVVAVPAEAQQIHVEALRTAFKNAKVSDIHLVHRAVAAGFGGGLPLHEPNGNMIVHVGGGVSEAAVMALGGIVYSVRVRAGGVMMDHAIIDYIKRTYNLLIGPRTARQIKEEAGSAYPLADQLTLEVNGRHLLEGVPKTIAILDEEIREAIAGVVDTIVRGVVTALERTPPELAADIIDRGMVLSGGLANLKNLDVRLREETGLAVACMEDAESNVISGLGHLMRNPLDLKKMQI